MKRVGGIFDAVVDRDNLREAFLKASRGKRHRADQRRYAAHLAEELERLRAGLLNLDYPVGSYARFTIHDPKEREISVAPFAERVLHHALMNVCEPHFDRWLIADTYACRRGKGQLRAVRRAQAFAARHAWFLKCDFRRFFDSIPHEGLVRMVARKFKDPFVVAWFGRIIAGYEKAPGRGLPIGNLTSQHLANLFLDPLDRLCQGAYVRYMDDFVLWGDAKDDLRRRRDAIVAFTRDRLGLELKESPFINRTALGMDFLGLRVFPHRLRLAKTACARFTRKAAAYGRDLAAGAMDETTYQRRMTALTAFAATADSRGFRQRYFRAHPISDNDNRVLRGGSYNNDASNCAFSYRNNNNPSNDNSNNGFRLFCRPAWNDRFDPGVRPVPGDGTKDGIRPDASSARRTLREGVLA